MNENQEKEFNEFKESVLTMITNGTTQNSLISQLNNYLKDIITTNSLKSPLSQETNDFLENFSVQIINQILQTKEKSKSIQKSYQSILFNYSKILSVIITQPYTKFINAAEDIVTQKSLNFYKMSSQYSYGVLTEVSQYFYDNIHEFIRPPLMENVINYYKNPDLIFNLSQAIQITSLIKPLSKFFEKPQLNEFVLSVLNAFKKWMESLKIEIVKNMNENSIVKLSNALFAMTQSTEIKNEITNGHIFYCIRLFQTQLLRLQFKALESIKLFLSKSYLSSKKITSFLKKEGFVSMVMNCKDMHHQLVPDFAYIFGFMAKNEDSNIDEVRKFWLLSASQHPSVIDYFFKPWYSLFYDLPNSMVNEFFLMVANEQKFPDSALKFLKKVAYKASEQPKEVLFNTLMDLLNKNEFSSSEDLVVDLLCSLIPTNNEKFCSDLQQKCIEKIANYQQINIALPLLKNNCRFVSEKKAREYFDIVLKSMLNEKVDVDCYFDLLIKFLEKMKGQFTNEEFNDLKKLISPLLNSKHFGDVCDFLRKLTKIKNGLVTNEMLYKIFETISTSKYFDSKSFPFIRQLYEEINAGNNSNQPINVLWMLFLNNSSCLSLCNYILSLFETNPKMFIEKCFMNIKEYENGSLILLDKFINYTEDGLNLDDLGILPNKFFDDEDFYYVNLNGELEAKLKVYSWISYKSFIQRISRILEKEPQRIRLKINERYLNSDNFHLQNSININVTCSSQGYISYVDAVKYKNPIIDVSNLPSSILLNENYSNVLFKLLKNSKNRLVLNILNKIPTIKSEFDRITDEKSNWKKIFSIKIPFLFLYRLNIIGNLIKSSNMNWIENFFNSNGLTYLLNIVLSKNLLECFTESEDIELAFKITILLMNIRDFEEQLEESISNLASKSIQQIIEFLNDDSIKPKLILDILTILKIFTVNHIEYIENNEDFNKLLIKLLFSPNASIRKEMLNIINPLGLESKKKIVSKLLPIALKEKCGEYFKLLTDVSSSTDDPNSLLNDLLSVLYSRYKLPEKEKSGIIKILEFCSPKQQFSNGLFSSISILMKRMDKIPDLHNLLNFLGTNTLFNTLKYYKFTNDILDILLVILERAPETGKYMLSQLKILASTHLEYNEHYNKMINEMKFSGRKLTIMPMKIELSSTARARGLRNLGATCYMNATLQQLHNITELREKVLKINFSNSGESEWINEFQYLFAKLSFYPSKAIDTLPFVSKWKGWDGQIINPREQQDAVEFLQMILERLDENVKGLTSMFQGQIIHTLVGRKVPYSSTSVENFLTLPLEVKNHKNVQESLKTFLVPDSFEGSNGYTVEGEGMIDADRYHKIKVSPKILIIQLKRFEYNLSTNTRVKVNSEYHFPLELDLSPVMENETSIKPKNENRNLYELIGVLMHMGSAIAGHYFSHVKRDDNEWFTFNDQQVKKCNGEDLPSVAAGGLMNYSRGNEYGLYRDSFENDTNAYLLFYRKIHDDADDIEIESESQNRISKISSTSDFQSETDKESSNEFLANDDDESSNKALNKESDASNKASNEPSNESLNKEDDASCNKDCEIDHDCLSRLVSDIQQVISTEIASTEAFSNLVMKLCSSDNIEDGEFLYDQMIQNLRLSSNKEKECVSSENDDYSNSEDKGIFSLTYSLGSTLMKLFEKKPIFADFVLMQDSNIDEFLIANDSIQARMFFADLLCNAISLCNHKTNSESINHFTEFMRSKLDSSLVDNFSDFNEFFTVLKKLVSATSEESTVTFDKENWKKSVIRFLTETIPNYSKSHQSQKIYYNIDLSAVFQLASMFSIDFSVIMDNLLQWSLSMKHSFELIRLISERISANEEATNAFINVLQSKDLSAVQMSLFFVIDLYIDDKFNKQRDDAIEKTILKQQSYKEFLDNSMQRVKDFNGKLSKRFLSFSQVFIRNFLYKNDSMTRTSFEQFVYNVFSLDNKDDLHEFMTFLIKDKKQFEMAVSKSSDDLVTPATAYFKILNWIATNCQFKDEILNYSKDLFLLLKKFGKEQMATSYHRCFGFVFSMFGANPKEFFDQVSSSLNSSVSNVLSKFVSSVPEDFINKGETISCFLQFLYPLECSQELFISKSDAFETMCLYGFNDWKSGQDLRIFISLKMNLPHDKKPVNEDDDPKIENLRLKICSILWNKTVFEKNILYGSISFIALSWSILKHFPKTSNVFFDNKCYEFLWRRISIGLKQYKKELRLRAKLKLFAAFTESYLQENKDKKFLVKGSRNSFLIKRYIKELCITTTSAINACFYTNFPTNQKIVVVKNSYEKAPEENFYDSKKSRKDSVSCPNLKEKEETIDFPKSVSHAGLSSGKETRHFSPESLSTNPSNPFSYYSTFISSTNSGKGGIFDFLKVMITADQYYLTEVSKSLLNDKQAIVASCQKDSQVAGAKFMTKLVDLLLKSNKIDEANNLITKEFFQLSSSKEFIFETINLFCKQMKMMAPNLWSKKFSTKDSHSNVYKIIVAFNNIYKNADDIKLFSADIKDLAFIVPESNKELNEEAASCERSKWCESAMKIVSQEISKLSKLKSDTMQIDILNESSLEIKIGIDFMFECSSKFNCDKPKITVSKTQLNSVISMFQNSGNKEVAEVVNHLSRFVNE